MGAPQIIMIIGYTVTCTGALFLHGKDKGKFNFFTTLISTIIEVAILKWGGFF